MTFEELQQLSVADKVVARFIKFVRPQPNGCWLWAGSGDKRYGLFWFDEKYRQATHFALKLTGRKSDSYRSVPDHLCKNTRCVQPDCLEVVTQQVNVLRGNGVCAVNAKKAHCKYGHALTPENVYTAKGNHRHCLTCNRARCLEYSRRVRGALRSRVG